MTGARVAACALALLLPAGGVRAAALPPQPVAAILERAAALREEGRAAEAARLLLPLAESRSPLGRAARYACAAALREAGDAPAAAALLWPESGRGPGGRLGRDSLRLAATLLEETGRPAEAASAWRMLEDAEPGRRRKAEWCFRRAEALVAAGDRAGAQALLLGLWGGETASPWGRRAGLALRREFPAAPLVPGETAKALDFARTLLKGGRNADAWDVVETLSDRRINAAAARAAERLRLQILYALRRNAELQRVADGLHAREAGSDLARYADSQALWACLRTDDAARAEELAARLAAASRDGGALAADARHALGTLYYCRGDWDRALRLLDPLEALPPSSRTREAALYKAAWAARRAGDAPGALTRMRRVAATASTVCAEPARYFTALWQEESGQGAAAVTGWKSLALGGGYWAAAAREALAARGVTVPPRRAKQPSDGGSPCGADAEIASALEAAGFPGFAADAFEPVVWRSRGDASARLRLASLLARSGEAGRAYALAQASFGDPERLDVMPREVSEAFYPRPFASLLPPPDPAVPESLAYAIVRRESGFDPSVLSIAGAVGLMQLMPGTAAGLTLADGTPPAEEDLIDPAVNLRLGIAYLARLKGLLGRDEAVVAAYNAGEERVGQWLGAFGAADEREFVAMVPYRETRLYTQRVLFDRSRYMAQAATELASTRR